MSKLPLRRPLVFLLLVLLPTAPASAWYDAGHKVIASIAFRRLSEVERARVVELLRAHPRFTEDFERKLPEDAQNEPARQEWLFQQAAVWPDLAREFRGEDWQRFHRSTWHYIDLPRYLSEADRAALEPELATNTAYDPPAEAQEVADFAALNIVQSIRRARRLAALEGTRAEDRAVLLCWLFHNVGDVHQPMHVGSLYSRRAFPTGDRGGNGIRTRERGNLHGVWDGLLGSRPPWDEARNHALTLLAAETTEVLEAPPVLDEAVWVNESRELVLAAAYDPTVLAYLRLLESHEEPETLAPLELPEEYLENAGYIARRRVVLAGLRLAAVLREVVAEQK